MPIKTITRTTGHSRKLVRNVVRGLTGDVFRSCHDVAGEPPGSPVRTRFTLGVERLAALLSGLSPRAAKERRRQRSLATLSTLVGAVVLARAVDDDALAEDLIKAAQASLAA